MNPINPWLDPDEVRRMAERLLAPAHKPDPGIRDAGFDSAFIGYAAGAPANAAPAQPAPPPAASPPPLPPVTIERTVTPPPATADAISSPFQMVTESRTVARGPFLDRITRFRDWFSSEFSASGIFILDREGSVIFDENGNEKLHSLARNLALASRKPGAPPANVRLKIGTRAILEVIPVDTAYGYLVLAAIVTDILTPPAIAAVMDGLSKAASPPSV
jgi:hypothetical protein